MQVQGEQSYQWSAYEATIEALVAAEVENLKPYETDAVWLQSDAGWEWECEDEADREPYPVYAGDIIQHLLEMHIYPQAGAWSNRRIEAFLNSGFLD